MELPIQARNAIARNILAISLTRQPYGRPRRLSDVTALSAIYYVCRTGCQWSALSHIYGNVSYKTVYHRFATWSKMRIFEGAFYDLAQKCNESHPHGPLLTDCTHVKNVRGAEVLGKNHADRARKSTKISILTNMHGVPLGMTAHPGNRNDSMTLPHLLNEAARKLRAPLTSHETLVGDAGYRGARCANAAIAHGLELHLTTRGAARSLHTVRWKVERTFAHVDLHRRVIMRYDVRIHTFKSFHFLAMMPQLAAYLR